MGAGTITYARSPVTSTCRGSPMTKYPAAPSFVSALRSHLYLGVVIGDCQSCCVERVRHVSDTELLPKSKPDAVRRLEVFTGAGRRRTWSAEQKARIVAESYESGETVSVVARRHALTAQQLFGWRRAARRAIEEVSANGSAFTPVIVEAAAPCAEAPAASMARAEQSPMIEITIGIATVRFAAWIDPAALAAVLRAVRAAT